MRLPESIRGGSLSAAPDRFGKLQSLFAIPSANARKPTPLSAKNCCAKD